MKEIAKLKIYNQDDRMTVASILVKNGYTISQIKEKRTETGKSVDYLIRVVEDEDNVASNR